MDEMLNRITKCIGPKHGAIKDLAEHLGVTPNVITNWKNGSSKSYRKYVNELAAYFGVSTDYLLGNTEKEKPLINGDEELTEYLEQLKTRPEMRILFSLTKNATKEEVERAVRIVEAALGK